LTHPFGKLLENDLRPHDRGWRIHEAFYANIRNFLMPGAMMLIEEVEPYKKEVFLPNAQKYEGPYDIRDEVPMESFERMTSQNGLKIESVFPLMEISGLTLYGLKIVART
jgi:hypothetical protein